MIEKIALAAGIILPFCNIPLIIKIIRRRSSKDISIFWVLGVWTCLALMAPAAFVSKDIVWRTFSIINFILFSLVAIFVFIYRNGK